MFPILVEIAFGSNFNILVHSLESGGCQSGSALLIFLQKPSSPPWHAAIKHSLHKLVADGFMPLAESTPPIPVEPPLLLSTPLPLGLFLTPLTQTSSGSSSWSRLCLGHRMSLSYRYSSADILRSDLDIQRHLLGCLSKTSGSIQTHFPSFYKRVVPEVFQGFFQHCSSQLYCRSVAQELRLYSFRGCITSGLGLSGSPPHCSPPRQTQV